MWIKLLFSTWALLLSAAVADCDSFDVAGSNETYTRGATQSSSSVGETLHTLHVSNKSTSTRVSAEVGETPTNVAGSSSSASAFVISFPVKTTSPRTEAPTVTSTPATIEPISTESSESSAITISNQQTSAPTTAASDSSKSSDMDTITSSISGSKSSDVDTITSSISGIGSTESNDDATSATGEDGEASIASAESDSSTFQLVKSSNCSDAVVDNVYTLYANCRSAFDLCVSASDYQIFPYQGVQPTQAQIQGMAESDACIAVFIIVIEANIPACAIGGMPLTSVVETLLKISVDLEEDIDDESPSADVFQELVAWRYEVDLAKAAGVPYDGDSELYAEFQTSIDAALANTTIRVNDNLSVDVRLSNGSYESFEDALDLVITDANTDAIPGYIKASSAVIDSEAPSSSNSQNVEGVVSESSNALPACTLNVWSLIVAVVASAFVLDSTGRKI